MLRDLFDWRINTDLQFRKYFWVALGLARQRSQARLSPNIGCNLPGSLLEISVMPIKTRQSNVDPSVCEGIRNARATLDDEFSATEIQSFEHCMEIVQEWVPTVIGEHPIAAIEVAFLKAANGEAGQRLMALRILNLFPTKNAAAGHVPVLLF